MQTTTTFSAPDIECESCANAIKNALRTVSGVEETRVNIEAKTVTVTHESEDGGIEPAVIAALDRAGFPAEPLARTA